MCELVAVSFVSREGELTDGTGVQEINHFLALNVYFELLVVYAVVAYWTGGEEVDLLFILGNIVSCEIDHIFAFRGSNLRERTFMLMG